MENKFFNLIIIIIFLFSFISTNIEYENITLEEETILLPKKQHIYYYINSESSENLPDFLEIIVEDEKNLNNYCYRHSILFYKQDSTFSNVDQFTQTSFSPIMWLTREQFKNGFYLSIESETELDPTLMYNYTMAFKLKNHIELYLDNQYNFHITEENALLDCFFIANLSSYSSDSLSDDSITIWAKGNKKITTTLNDTLFEKHSLYNAYIIKIDELKEYNYSLTIEGTIGDYINIGSSFFQGNINRNYLILNEDEIYGYLKKNVIEKNCFNVASLYGYSTPYLKVFDDIDMEISLKSGESTSYRCVTLPEGINELFYLLHYLIPNNFLKKEYFSLNTGIIYNLQISENETIGYIPIKLEDNFNYLTFNIYPIEAKAYIQTCENYPFCSVDKNMNESILIQAQLSTYTFSIHKDEFNFDISSFNKKQKMLVISCNIILCDIYVNIYTDKTKIKLFEIPVQYKLLRKENEDNLLIKYYCSNYYLNDFQFISIENLSGDIELDSKIMYKNYTYENIILFPLNSTDDILSLKIKAKRNSIYSIKCHFNKKLDTFSNETFIGLGGNYLLDFEKDKYVNLKLINNKGEDCKDIYKFVNFYPINCNFKATYRITNIASDNPIDLTQYNTLISDNFFYQKIYCGNLHYEYCGDFYFENITHNNDSSDCKLYFNSYSFYNDTDLFYTSLILEEGAPKTFVFNEENKKIMYSYYFSGNNSDLINITLILSNKQNYNLNLFINNIQIKKNMTITSSRIIQIKSDNWKKICNNMQICRITFDITSEDFEQDTFIKIAVNYNLDIDEDEDNNGNEDNNNGNKTGEGKSKKTTIALAIVFSILGIILIIAAIFIIFKLRRRKSNLNEEINKDFAREKELLENN